MSDERYFGQRVMAAAGVAPLSKTLPGGFSRDLLDKPHYPDPLAPEGFVALWDALEAQGWFVHWDSRTQPPRYAVTLLQYDYQHHTWKPGSARGNDANRAAALLEAAAQALRVEKVNG